MVTGFLEDFMIQHFKRSPALRRTFQTQEGVTVVAKSPGSLGSAITDPSQIGSLGVKIESLGTSLLLFSNGKLKVSGGFGGNSEDTELHGLSKSELEQWLWDQKIEPSLQLLDITLYREEVTVSVFLLNGFHKHPAIDATKYIDVCNFLQERNVYPRVVMPSAYSEDINEQRKRGRIVAMKLYINDSSKSSIHFDYSGKVQFFAFISPKEMKAQLGLFLNHMQLALKAN